MEADRKPLTIEWDSISSSFDALHLNWDPARFAHSDTAHLALAGKHASSSTNSVHTTHLQLKMYPPLIAGQEVWIHLSRHELSPKEKDRFIGLRVAAHWSTAADAVAGTRVDDGVSPGSADCLNGRRGC